MKNFKVLVIDDDMTTCSLLETILQMEDFQTSSVSNVEQKDIISILDREKPHLLIMDFHLGSTDTLQYLSVIKEDAGWQNLPVIMTSAIDRKQQCLRTGANGFILKPFKYQEVTQIVKELGHNGKGE